VSDGGWRAIGSAMRFRLGYSKGSIVLPTPSGRYHALREELLRLQSADVPDMPAIERVLNALDAEYRRLKTEDGQHGNNPIEWRHGEPLLLEIRPEDVLPPPSIEQTPVVQSPDVLPAVPNP